MSCRAGPDSSSSPSQCAFLNAVCLLFPLFFLGLSLPRLAALHVKVRSRAQLTLALSLLQCIGQRNYLSFIAFLLSAVVAGLYSLGFSAYHISQRASASQLRQWDTIGAIVVLVATFAFLVPVGGLAAYHAQLVWTNRTTIEMVRPACPYLQLLLLNPTS